MNLKKILSYQDAFFFLLAMIAGACICFSYHNFQLHIAQGDHGNNLYVFRRTFEGALPYRDYWWVYGPLMPYYYSLFFLIFGVSIHSVLIGYAFLNFFCGLVFYRILRLFFPSYLVFFASIYFWIFSPPFEHTYNHVGGILLILGALYGLFAYVKESHDRYLAVSLLSILLLSFVKLNMGLSTLAAFVVSLFVVDKMNAVTMSKEKVKVYALAIFGVPMCILAVYGFLLMGLPGYVIRQCVLTPATDPNHAPLIDSFRQLWNYYATEMNRQNLDMFGFLLGILFIYFLYLFLRRKLDESSRKNLKISFVTLGIFFVFNLHEYFFSGVLYRIYWVECLEILAIFLIVLTALVRLPKFVQVLVCAVIVWSALTNHYLRHKYFNLIKVYIPLKRAQIFTANPDSWISTVRLVTQFLEEHLLPKETFLAIPSDELYYFLTDRSSPTRQAEFGVDIAPEQEQEIIAALEAQKIRYIVISNRFRTPETGFGKFGQAYGLKLGEYISQHYVVAYVFGDWDKDPSWVQNHGVVIAERR